MKLTGTVSVACPACGVVTAHALLQSLNTREDPASKAQLLRGELNVAACACGKRTQLASDLVFHDPDAGLLCHVCPDGEAAMQRAEAAFAASFAGSATTGIRRIVPSVNALVEKVKIHDAGLLDWAIEMTKVLLLASIEVDDDDRVLLFTGADRDAGLIHWLLFDPHGDHPVAMSSALAAYHRLVDTSAGFPPTTQHGGELRVDRAWAIEAMRQLISSAN